MVFFNMNICGNNIQDIRRQTEYAHDHRISTDDHINETPMLEQDEHFKHLSDNPTYLRLQDWLEIDSLVDWLIAQNEAGHQMMNSVQRLREIKAFIRMASASDLKYLSSNGDGSGTNGDIAPQVAGMPGFVQDHNGRLNCAEWNCRAGQNNVMIRTDGTVAACFPMYALICDWGNRDQHKFDSGQLAGMKKTCQPHGFSTLKHNLAYGYNDARVIKFVATNLVKNRMKGGARSFQN